MWFAWKWQLCEKKNVNGIQIPQVPCSFPGTPTHTHTHTYTPPPLHTHTCTPVHLTPAIQTNPTVHQLNHSLSPYKPYDRFWIGMMLSSRFFPMAVLYLIVGAHPELYFTELNSDKYWLVCLMIFFIHSCRRFPTKKKTLMKWSYLTRFKWKRKWFVYLKVVEWELKFWKLSQGRTAAALVKRREEKLACTLCLSQLRPSLPHPSPLPLYRPTRWPSCQRSVPFQPLCVSSNSLEPLLHSSPPIWLWPPLEEQLVPFSSSLYLTLLLRKAVLLLLLWEGGRGAEGAKLVVRQKQDTGDVSSL